MARRIFLVLSMAIQDIRVAFNACHLFGNVSVMLPGEQDIIGQSVQIMTRLLIGIPSRIAMEILLHLERFVPDGSLVYHNAQR